VPTYLGYAGRARADRIDEAKRWPSKASNRPRVGDDHAVREISALYDTLS
jgi:hypothetical protein